MTQETISLADALGADPSGFKASWAAGAPRTTDAGAGASVRTDVDALFGALLSALRAGAESNGLDSPAFDALRSELAGLSRARATRGFPIGETLQFVMAAKAPLFEGVRARAGADASGLFEAMRAASALVDKMAEWTAVAHQRAREDVIARQQADLLELSTPVVKLWDGVLAAPMIGTLDSSRTQLVMEALLTKIVETGSEIAIIDITGVPTVDTLVAQHLLATVAAIRLMGADAIISGVRPQIAQTIVHLGIDLRGVTTKATLAGALKLAMARIAAGGRFAKA